MYAEEQLAAQAEEAAKNSAWEEMCQAFGGEPKKNLKGVRTLANGRYAAEIRDKVAGRKVWLGTFPSLKLAACAYELAARGMLSGGRHAVPNFQQTPSPALRAEFDDELAAQALRYREADGGGRPVPACLLRFARVPVPPVEEFPEQPPFTVEGPGCEITFVRSIPPEPVYIEAVEESYARDANLHLVNLQEYQAYCAQHDDARA